MAEQDNETRVQLAKTICASASEQVRTHLVDLDEYLNDNENSGLEGWFRVAAVLALRRAKCTEVHVNNRGPDLKFNFPESSETLFLELKAGSFCRGYIWQLREGAGKYNDLSGFLGCLFLGRFNSHEEDFRTRLQLDECRVICLQRASDSGQFHSMVGGDSEETIISGGRLKVQETLSTGSLRPSRVALSSHAS